MWRLGRLVREDELKGNPISIFVFHGWVLGFVQLILLEFRQYSVSERSSNEQKYSIEQSVFDCCEQVVHHTYIYECVLGSQLEMGVYMDSIW